MAASGGEPGLTRVEVRGLSKSFKLGTTVLDAVKDVSFTIAKGEFVALLGPSGSGKSTVLNMIATLLSRAAARS